MSLNEKFEAAMTHLRATQTKEGGYVMETGNRRLYVWFVDAEEGTGKEVIFQAVTRDEQEQAIIEPISLKWVIDITTRKPHWVVFLCVRVPGHRYHAKVGFAEYEIVVESMEKTDEEEREQTALRNRVPDTFVAFHASASGFRSSGIPFDYD